MIAPIRIAVRADRGRRRDGGQGTAKATSHVSSMAVLMMNLSV